ncbi:hypothetical protein A2U01_0105770, partial [Trifolium medium]|nr:hypothetical protein [Trifolium medium]
MVLAAGKFWNHARSHVSFFVTVQAVSKFRPPCFVTDQAV